VQISVAGDRITGQAIVAGDGAVYDSFELSARR